MKWLETLRLMIYGILQPTHHSDRTIDQVLAFAPGPDVSTHYACSGNGGALLHLRSNAIQYACVPNGMLPQYISGNSDDWVEYIGNSVFNFTIFHLMVVRGFVKASSWEAVAWIQRTSLRCPSLPPASSFLSLCYPDHASSPSFSLPSCLSIMMRYLEHKVPRHWCLRTVVCHVVLWDRRPGGGSQLPNSQKFPFNHILFLSSYNVACTRLHEEYLQRSFDDPVYSTIETSKYREACQILNLYLCLFRYTDVFLDHQDAPLCKCHKGTFGISSDSNVPQCP